MKGRQSRAGQKLGAVSDGGNLYYSLYLALQVKAATRQGNVMFTSGS
jgi:hypothetical protein